jgi:hypothetical protein
MEADGEFRMDHTHFSVVSPKDPDDAVQYWLTRAPEERLRALEHLTRTSYGEAACSARIQRVFEVVHLEEI